MSEDAKWEVVPNPDGSVSLKSTSNGNYLGQKGNAIDLHSHSANSDWWLSRVGSNATNLLFRNKVTGEYLVRRADGTLGSSPVLDEKAASWSAFPDDVSLGSALVAALAAAGGDGLVQNSVTRVCLFFLSLFISINMIFFFRRMLAMLLVCHLRLSMRRLGTSKLTLMDRSLSEVKRMANSSLFPTMETSPSQTTPMALVPSGPFPARPTETFKSAIATPDTS